MIFKLSVGATASALDLKTLTLMELVVRSFYQWKVLTLLAVAMTTFIFVKSTAHNKGMYLAKLLQLHII